MFSTISALILVIATAFFQYKHWKNQNHTSKIEKSQKMALETVQDLSQLVSTRLYRQKRYIWALSSKDMLLKCKDINRYREILFKWNEGFGNTQTKLKFSFGPQIARELEIQIQEPLSTIHRKMTTLQNKKNIDADINALIIEMEKIGVKSNDFLNKLLTLISNLEIENYSPSKKISYDNRKNLSVTYLLNQLIKKSA